MLLELNVFERLFISHHGSVCACFCLGQIVRLMTCSFLTPSKVMCLRSLVVSPWRYVSCQYEKNSEAEGGMNRKDGQKQEGGQVHLNVILIRRPLPFLINKIFVIGKVVVVRSRPLGLCVCLCVCVCTCVCMDILEMLTPSSHWPALRKKPSFSFCSRPWPCVSPSARESRKTKQRQSFLCHQR